MMKNKKGMIILSIILAVQFIIPLSVWGYETYKNKELEQKGQEIKLLVDYVNYDEGRIEFQVLELEGDLHLDYSDEFGVFSVGEDGFATVETTSELPETDLYVSVNSLARVYRQDWCFKYKSAVTSAQDEYDYYQLYNSDIEQANINHGFCEGTETEAYAVFKVYKNRFKVVNVYIDGMLVDEVIEKYNNNEWDNSRYDEHYGDSDDYEYYYDDESKDYYKEYYDEELDEFYKECYDEETGEYYKAYYDEELDEYITEPVAA